MRYGRGGNVSYTHTLEEVVGAIFSSHAFSHLDLGTVLDYMGGYPYKMGCEINFAENPDGSLYEVSRNNKWETVIETVTFYDIHWVAKHFGEKFGYTCRLCKDVHHENCYDMNCKIGVTISEFLRDDEIFAYSPMCYPCTEKCENDIWGTKKTAILRDVKNPTKQQQELAVCEWMANIVNKRILQTTR